MSPDHLTTSDVSLRGPFQTTHELNSRAAFTAAGVDGIPESASCIGVTHCDPDAARLLGIRS